MKKRTCCVLLLAFFSSFLIGSIFSFFLTIKSKKDILSGYSNCIFNITQKEAELTFDKYFNTGILYNKITRNEDPHYDGLLSKISGSYPYYSKIEVISEEPFFKNYAITNNDDILFFNFQIVSSEGTSKIKNEFVRIEFDTELFLKDIGLLNHFTLSSSPKASNLVYGIKVESKDSLVNKSHAIHGMIFGVFTALFFYRITRKYNSYYYYPEGLEKIIYLLEKTEEFSANHSRNVAEIAYYLGKKYGLKRKRLNDLKVASFLHDIGKISIPVELLNKDGVLSTDEFGVVKKHVTYSAEIIENFDSLRHLKDIILYHHEKLDGTGYPEGLKGNQIPLESRILSVADIFEALVGQRPYRAQLSSKEAIELMKEMAIDKEILSILCANIDKVCELITYKKEHARKRNMVI